jgi:hypothetical protein
MSCPKNSQKMTDTTYVDVSETPSSRVFEKARAIVRWTRMARRRRSVKISSTRCCSDHTFKRRYRSPPPSPSP